MKHDGRFQGSVRAGSSCQLPSETVALEVAVLEADLGSAPTLLVATPDSALRLFLIAELEGYWLVHRADRAGPSEPPVALVLVDHRTPRTTAAATGMLASWDLRDGIPRLALVGRDGPPAPQSLYVPCTPTALRTSVHRCLK